MFLLGIFLSPCIVLHSGWSFHFAQANNAMVQQLCIGHAGHCGPDTRALTALLGPVHQRHREKQMGHPSSPPNQLQRMQSRPALMMSIRHVLQFCPVALRLKWYALLSFCFVLCRGLKLCVCHDFYPCTAILPNIRGQRVIEFVLL